MGVIKDITGMRSGRLVALKIDENVQKEGTYWVCQCDCGNLKTVRGDHIRQQRVKSCGCFQREMGHIKGLIYGKDLAGWNRKEIEGQRFGNLVAVKVVGFDNHHIEQWKCKCDCGATHVVNKLNLLSGHTTSCGCKMSSFEKVVSGILSQNNISFKKNATFDSCRFENGALAKFDFYIENKYVIECDGEQHLHSTGTRFTDERVGLIQKRDTFKNIWCKEHNIPIIRLPHTAAKSVTLNDLLLETSDYVLKES